MLEFLLKVVAYASLLGRKKQRVSEFVCKPNECGVLQQESVTMQQGKENDKGC
jgi:hypothetical protein